MPLIRADAAAGGLFVGVVGFVGQDSLFGGAAATAFLAAKFLDSGALGLRSALLEALDFVEQKLSGEKAVEALLARGLAFDLEAGGTVKKHHARGCLVDVLAAVPARADKGLLEVGFTDVQHGHAPGELVFLFQADGQCAHGGSVAEGRRRPLTPR